VKRRQRVLGFFALGLAALALPVPGGVAEATEAAVAPVGDAHIPAGVHAQFYNGQPSSVKEFPFIVAGLREGGTRPQGQTCTGSVVAPRKILIAAHCKAAEGKKTFLYGLDDLNAGGGTRVGVVGYDLHPKYVNFDQGYDVAVVTTDADLPVPGGAYAQVATSADTELNKPGKSGVGVGYGKKDFNDDSKDVTVDKATLPIREPSSCNGVGAGFQTATMVCAGYPDGNPTILPGDSGGPLIVDGKVVGVASWSRSDFKWYSVYGRLNNDMGDWVKQQIGDVTPPNQDKFSLAVSPGSVKADPGKYVSASVTSKAGKNGAETVELTASGLPEGATATFQPSGITSGDTAKVTIETAANTPEKAYTITISGKGTTDTATAPLTLTVGKGEPPAGDLKVSVTPGSGTARPGFFINATVSATGSGTLKLSASGPGLQIAPFFNPQTISSGGSSTMQIVAPFTPGTYPITITATDPTGKSATTPYLLTVQ
jgi:secreted trypsin-like serine protease